MTSQKSRKRVAEEVSAEERELQNLVFGNGLIDNDTNTNKRKSSRSSSSSKTVGSASGSEVSVEILLDRKGSTVPKTKTAATTGAVWQDEDDSDLQIDLLATDRLKKLNKDVIKDSHNTKKKISKNVTGSELSQLLQERFHTKQLEWAKVSSAIDIDDNDPDMAILRQGGSMVEGQDGKGPTTRNSDGPLPPGKIDIARLVDANAADPSKEAITSVMFHASGSMLLTGGHDRHLRFFRIDGKTNDRILTVKFNDMSISNAAFLGSSTEVVLSGRKPFFYGYDTESGHVSKYPGLMGHGLKSHENMLVSPQGTKLAFLGAGGYIHVACGKRKTWMMDLKMNTAARSGAFINEETMVTSGLDADVYVWDLRMQGRCVSRFKHEDGTCSSAVAAMPASDSNPQYLAVGAESGAVSLFNGLLLKGASQHISASKSLLHLTTQITTLAFHPSSEILALASNCKVDQLRLLHVKSGTIFSNWPTEKTPLRKVQCISFSPSGAYMAAGNDRGRVLLYSVNHYK